MKHHFFVPSNSFLYSSSTEFSLWKPWFYWVFKASPFCTVLWMQNFRSGGFRPWSVSHSGYILIQSVRLFMDLTCSIHQFCRFFSPVKLTYRGWNPSISIHRTIIVRFFGHICTANCAFLFRSLRPFVQSSYIGSRRFCTVLLYLLYRTAHRIVQLLHLICTELDPQLPGFTGFPAS